jgi:CubicO group peptidase (beta-lactamase class C family)
MGVIRKRTVLKNNFLLSTMVAGLMVVFAFQPAGRNNGLHRNSSAPDSIAQVKAMRIDYVMDSLSKKGYFNGQVLVGQDGKIIYNKAFGYSNLDTRAELDNNSVFQLASVNKPITATAVLILYEQGKLKLDEDIRTYFPKLPYAGITVKHLLQHTGGLPEYFTSVGRYWNKSKYITNKDVVDLLSKYKPKRLFAPGQKYKYNNTGYALLALIIEKASGMAYDEFLETHIFLPLQMIRTTVFNPAKDTSMCREVTSYFFDGVRCRPYIYDYRNGVMGDKGTFTTNEDLYKFDQGLYNETILKKETQELAYSKGILNNGDTTEYGLGWRMRQMFGQDVILHYGFWNSFRTGLVRFPETNTTIIIFNNITGYGKSKINNRQFILDQIGKIVFPAADSTITAGGEDAIPASIEEQ